MNSIATASQSPDLTIQSKILEDTKESTDSLSEFLYAIKNSLVGTKAVDHAKKIESEKLKLKTSLNKLCSTIEGSSADNSEMAKAIERIEFLLSSDNGNTAAPKQSYQDYCALIEKYGKTAVETVGDILSKTKTMEQYRLQGLKMSEICENISPIVTFATMLAEDPKVKESLSSSFRDFAATVIRLFEAMRLASGKSSADQASRAKLSQSAREVSVAVSSIIAAAKDGSKGLIVCQESISNINDMIGDLDSVYIFAQAGQLEPVDPKDNFLRHKDSMMSSAKTLIEQVKGFITAVSGSQDELAVLSVASVNTLLILKDIVKKGATSITSADNNMQLHLLSAAKTVAESLQLLIATSMSASGKSNQDPTIVAFSDAVKKEFGAVAELVRLAKVLSDESLRGARALEVAIKDIDEAIEELRSDKPAYGTSLPEEVATLAKLLATAAASIVTLSGKEGKQDEMVASSNLIKKQIQDLCRAGKAVTANAPEDHKDQMIEAVSKSSISTQALLKLIKQSREGGDMALIKLHIQAAAKTVALAVSEIVGASSNLIPAGYVDMSDPNVVAERELLAAASSIEQAAKILSSFKPVDSPDKTIEDLSFEGQILEAAKSIAMASSALVKYFLLTIDQLLAFKERL